MARAEAVCASRGKRLTENRRAVLRLLLDGHHALGAYQIIKRFDWKGRSRAPIQVYRALEFLEAMGLAHRVASSNAYVACYQFSGQHGSALLVCEDCGVVVESGGPELERAVGGVTRRAGFQARTQFLEVLGLCPKCARKTEDARP